MYIYATYNVMEFDHYFASLLDTLVLLEICLE